MPRQNTPHEKTVYFPHDSNARLDEKMLAVRMKYKASGYGVYFMLIERLASEKDHTLVRNYDILGYDLRVETTLIKSIVEDFDLFQFSDDGTRFWSASLLERMNRIDEIKRTRREAANSRWKKGKEADDNQQQLEFEDTTDETAEATTNQVQPGTTLNMIPDNQGYLPGHEEDSVRGRLLQLFKDFYTDKKRTEYSFDFIRDNTNFTFIIDKVRAKMIEEKYVYDADTAEAWFRNFLEKSWNLSDKWIKEHYSLNTLNAQFNTLYTLAKDGREQQTANGGKRQYSTEFVERIKRGFDPQGPTR